MGTSAVGRWLSIDVCGDALTATVVPVMWEAEFSAEHEEGEKGTMV